MHELHLGCPVQACVHGKIHQSGLAPITSHFGRLLARRKNRFLFAYEMRKGLQSLDFSFEADSLTHYGGLFLIQRFCNKLDLRRRLQRILRAAPAWTDFDPVDLVLMTLFLLIAGVQRFNKSDKLQYDGFFLSLLGLETLPDETSIRRFLKRLS